ncbi:RHS repeat-associated core domain-containing protein [Pseudomonas aeruginosa]|nr:RHS repeat-associated core domain-containing protein [Pseudomonas aeruginosa]
MLYLHGDHLDTPRLATDASGQIAWQWQSDAFGRGEALSQGSTRVNLRFPGQYYDAESGLHYNYFRDYDPETGRYVESDPIGLDGGLNTYAYVGSNPVGLVDPNGLSPTATAGAGAGFVVGGPPGAVVGGLLVLGWASGEQMLLGMPITTRLVRVAVHQLALAQELRQKRLGSGRNTAGFARLPYRRQGTNAKTLRLT